MPFDGSKAGERHPNLAPLLEAMPADEAGRLEEVWNLVGDEEPTSFPTADEVDRAMERFEVRIDADGRPAQPPSPVRREAVRMRRTDRPAGTSVPVRRSRVAWAALAAILLMGALGLYAWFRPVTRVALPGQQLVFTLPDGSRVELNSGSRLRYARRFGDVRGAYLTGEAFFEVAEEERPFIVGTFNAQIRVLGTRFSVRAWPGGFDEGTTVALEAGRVALAPAGRPERAVEMRPGEMHRVVSGATDLELHPPPGGSVGDATAWRRGELIFKNQLLGVVLADVERRFGIDIQVHPAQLQHTRINLALRRPESAETVVRTLALSLGLAYRETSTGFDLFEDAASAL